MPKILSLSLTSLTSLLLAATVATSALSARAAAPDPSPVVDADWIVQNIAQPAQTSTPFVEMRSSPLLKAPLRIAGEYRRPDADTLVREVRSPYAETTTLSKGKASIVREGRRTRTFSLSRAPELASLQQVFGSLLAGDVSAVDQSYQLQPSGTRDQWSLRMTPSDPALAKRLRSITLHGQGEELRCIETVSANGKELQRTLLASGAAEAVGQLTEQAMTTLCSGATR